MVRNIVTHTVSTCVVGLHVDRFDLAVLNNERISLAAHASEDGRPVKADVKSFGELAGRVTKEPNL